MEKDVLIKNFTDRIKIKIDPLIMAMIDECADNIINGNVKIDGRLPNSVEEYQNLMSYSVVLCCASLQGVAQGLVSSGLYFDNVDLEYRGENYQISRLWVEKLASLSLDEPKL